MKLLLSLQKGQWCCCIPRYGHLKEECASELGELSKYKKQSSVKTLCFQCQVWWFDLWSRTWDPTCLAAKKKVKAHTCTPPPHMHTCRHTQGSLAPGGFIYLPKAWIKDSGPLYFQEDAFRNGRNTHPLPSVCTEESFALIPHLLPLAMREMLPASCLLSPQR